MIQVNSISSNFLAGFGQDIQYFHASSFISPMHETSAIRIIFALRELGRDPHTWEMLDEGGHKQQNNLAASTTAERRLWFQPGCSFCPLLLVSVVISFLMDCCSKGLEMSNKSNLLFPLQDNTSYIFGVQRRAVQGEQSHERIPGKFKGKCRGCKELTQSNRDRQQSSEPGEGEGRGKCGSRLCHSRAGAPGRSRMGQRGQCPDIQGLQNRGSPQRGPKQQGLFRTYPELSALQSTGGWWGFHCPAHGNQNVRFPFSVRSHSFQPEILTCAGLGVVSAATPLSAQPPRETNWLPGTPGCPRDTENAQTHQDSTGQALLGTPAWHHWGQCVVLGEKSAGLGM